MTKKLEKIYLVWETDAEGTEDEYGYYLQYDDLLEAVKEHPGKEIFEAMPKSIGEYSLHTKAIKLRKRKVSK